ncbi:MAG TPA: SusC/RagA family TonB-linked outer membrane protein, partial [Chryseolinea sp.]|nr:SusC/RagA family TonB-linked outer membrane protein [Chryseolinea sp.]
TSSEDGSPLPGVNVLLKGTTTGSVTDPDGKYSISTPSSGGVLVFTFIGLKSQEIEIGSQTVVNITMAVDAQQLSEVVVTALGVSREKSSLGYATQAISDDNIRVARETNVNTALAGKIAGVQIVSGSGAKFGAPAIRIRGIRGLSGGSPLYVLDGIVVSDPASINMDNIKDINVLKGANSAALYGARARDGVVVLTSKSGGNGDAVSIDINHTTTFEKVYVLPEYQNEYGGGYSQTFPTFDYNASVHDPGLASLDGMPMTEFYADESWGPKLDGTQVAQWDSFTKGTSNFGKAYAWSPQPDNVRDYFRTGVMNNTSINIGKSGNNYSLNTTFTKSSRTGVMENTSQDKLFFNINLKAQLSKKLELTTVANYNKENTFGNLFEGYNSIGSNVNQWFQRQLDINTLKQYYRLPNGTYTSWNINSPSDTKPLYWDNPYTTIYANTSEFEKEIYNAKFGLSYEIIDGLRASVQATRNSEDGWGNAKIASGTLSVASFATYSYEEVEDNIQGMLQYDKRFGENFSVNALAGINWRTNTIKTWSEATTGGLSVDNLFNISASTGTPIVRNFVGENKVNSYFGELSLGYKDMIFLDGSVREDYDARLPNGKNNYTYPAVSASFVFSELTNLNFLSFGKVRAGYAKVGNEIGRVAFGYEHEVYQTQQTFALGVPYGSNPITSVPNSLISQGLRAATTSSTELGLELGFFNNRAKAEFSYYHQDNSDELLNITIPASSGGTGFLTNSVQSYTKGWELALGGTPIQDLKGFNWDVNFNIAQNTVFIEDLGYGLNAFALSNGFRGTSTNGGWGNPQALARKDEEWGVITGRKYRRDENGNKVVDADGYPLYDANKDLGHILPDFTGGIFNRFTYKNFELSFTIDYQFGGKFLSISRMFGAYSGLTSETVGNNDKGNPMRNDPSEGGGLTFGGVHEDGTPNTTYLAADEYWKSLFALHEEWMYDATFIKMRELRIGYNVPSSMLAKTNFIKGASIAFVANNPFLIHSKVDGIDPSEISGDAVEARNNGAWSESGNLPGTRTFGFDLRLKF